jgi:hypothetical protein
MGIKDLVHATGFCQRNDSNLGVSSVKILLFYFVRYESIPPPPPLSQYLGIKIGRRPIDCLKKKLAERGHPCRELSVPEKADMRMLPLGRRGK